jgi:hypothetical protein
MSNLVRWARDLQDAVLTLRAVDGAEPMADRSLGVVAYAGWIQERAERYWLTTTRHLRPDSTCDDAVSHGLSLRRQVCRRSDRLS